MVHTVKVFSLSSGLNMSSISSSELQWIPLFVHNSPVTLLPNWFWNSKEESPVVEIYWNSKKFSEQKARVRAMTWVLKVSPWSTTRPVHNPSSIQLSRPDTWWDHPSKRSPARDTDTTSCHSLNNVTFFCVVNHQLKSGLNTKQTRTGTLNWLVFVHQAFSFLFYFFRFITGGQVNTQWVKVLCWLIQIQQRCSPKLNAIKGTKSSAAGNLCAPWLMINSEYMLNFGKSVGEFISLDVYLSPSDPPARSSARLLPFPPMWDNFSWTAHIKCGGRGLRSNLETASAAYIPCKYRVCPSIFGRCQFGSPSPCRWRQFHSRQDGSNQKKRCQGNLGYYFKYFALQGALNMSKERKNLEHAVYFQV